MNDDLSQIIVRRCLSHVVQCIVLLNTELHNVAKAAKPTCTIHSHQNPVFLHGIYPAALYSTEFDPPLTVVQVHSC